MIFLYWAPIKKINKKLFGRVVNFNLTGVKLNAIVLAPAPLYIKATHFHRGVNYYRKFIPNMGDIAVPMFKRL